MFIEKATKCGFVCLGLSFVMFFLLQRTSFAAEEQLSEFFQEIQNASAKVQSFSCKFVQEKRMALFSEPVIFHGKLTVIRPDRLRWEFTDPVPSALIFNGKSGMRCNDKAPPSQFDLQSDPIMRTVAEQLWLWLGGDYSKLQEKYEMSTKETALIITPKDKKAAEYIGSITITFNRESKQPDSVVITESGGDRTEMIFNSYVLNGPIAEDNFNKCKVDE
jgi:outer membrane lipoprotein-sorting protein